MAFGQWTGTDDFAAPQTAMRNSFLAAFKRAGYMAMAADQSNNKVSGAWIVRPDPVYPDRQALVFSSGNNALVTQGSAYTQQAGIKKVLPSQGKAVVGGFSLYVPPEFVPNAYSVNAANALYVIATTAGNATFTPDATNTLFVVNTDLSISNFANARQSTKVLVPGRIAYLEYRVADNEVRVWIDDVLVLQSTVSLAIESIGFVMYQNGTNPPGSFLQGAAGRWAISNWYNLTEDAQAPNVRLGPTTRVIGARPNNDVDVHFGRPSDATSNAQVAGQDLVDQPVMTLQSSNAGDMDIYSTNKDTSTSSGKLIHAIATKALVSNLESNPHTLRPLIVSAAGVEKEDPRPKEFRALTSPFNGKTMYGVARRPIDGKVFASGQGPCLFATATGNADATAQWTQIMDEGVITPNSICFVAFRSDGVGVIMRRDFKMQIIPAGSDIPGATFATPATATYQPNGMIVLPDNTIIVPCTGGRVFRCPGDKDPAVIANWSSLATATTSDLMGMLYHPILKRLVAQVGASTSVITSDDNGLTWTVRATGVGANFSSTVGQSQISFDGSWFTIMNQNTNTPNYIRRSQDAISWTAPTYNTNTSGQSVIGFMFGDAITGTTLATASAATAVTSSDGGANWRRLSVFSGALFAACVLPNGDWFMVGAAGLLMAYTSAIIDTALVPLAGYVMAFNASTVNPDTGAAWTPAEAAASKFGMRVTS